MVAYFSSKFKKQIYAAFTASLLVFCLLGSHWVGFSHSISHAHLQSQTEASPASVDAQPSLHHSSDVCHLFDALSLAGFIAQDSEIAIAISHFDNQSDRFDNSLIAQAPIERYQSRAPPTLLL